MEYTREFEFNGVRYRSSEDSVELSLSGAGRCRVDAKDEETADAFRDVLTALLPNIFELCGDSGVPYNFIAVKPDVITQVTKEVFAQILPEDSPTLISLAFTALGSPPLPEVRQGHDRHAQCGVLHRVRHEARRSAGAA